MMTGNALLVVAVVGALSAFIPATIAITPTDIKKVLAYSTISQLGYMIMALGIGSFAFGFFHLVTHAFFKAGLFLGAGSVIHAMHHEQEITEMGGLKKKLPVTYVTFLIYCLAISGVPLTSGFLTKDGILAGSYAFGLLTGNTFFAIVGFFVALLTAFYMFRLLILTFHGTPRNQHKYDHAHESPFLMIAPLVLLAVLSIFIFYTANPLNADSGWVLSKWIKTPASVVPEHARYSFMVPEKTTEAAPVEHIIHSEMYTEALHHAHIPSVLLSLALAGIGILLAFALYQWKKIDVESLTQKIKPLYTFSLNKWYFDELYQKTFVAFLLGISNLLAWIDANIVDGIVNGTASVTRLISRLSGVFDAYVVDGAVNVTATFSGLIGLMFRKIQTGKVQAYVVLVVFSLVLLLLFFVKI